MYLPLGHATAGHGEAFGKWRVNTWFLGVFRKLELLHSDPDAGNGLVASPPQTAVPSHLNPISGT